MVDGTTLAVGLRALKAVAAADGVIEARERRLMEAVTKALAPGSVSIDTDAVTPIEAGTAAARVTDAVARERIVQAQLVMALIDGDPDARELEVIRGFAAAFEVDEPRLANLEQLVRRQHHLLKLDLNRRSKMTQEAVAHAYREAGLRGAWRSFAPFLSKHLANDPALAARYEALGELPEGSFGRAYHAHIRSRGFAFPGEPGGFPEVFVKHDLCHVLGGYDTDPTGECEVVAFIAGFMQADPFWYLFMVLIHMHLGIETFQDNPLGEDAFDPDRVLAALEKGRGVSRDLYDPTIDWWPLYERPLDEVRAELGVRG